MAANTSPIYSKVGDIQFVTLLAAAAATDGTTATLLFAADATNGGRVDRIIVKALGTNVASVLRIFVNNGGAVGTATNNTLVAEANLVATTASAVAAITPVIIPGSGDTTFPMVLPPGYRLYAALGTTVAAGYAIAAIGGKY